MTDAKATDVAHRGERQARGAYGLALAALLFSTLMVIVLDSPVASSATLFAMALQVTALILTVRVSGVSRRVWVRILAVSILIFAASIVGALTPGDTGTVLALGGWLFLVLATIAGIVGRLARFERVTLTFVMGLLCVYLLLGLTFGLVYSTMDLVGSPVFAQGERSLSSSVYFSFITLATVGFGDLTPANALVRAFAVAEAMLGQLYLVSVVAAAVGRLGSGRREAAVLEESGRE